MDAREQEEARRSLALCEALIEEYHRMLQNEDDQTIRGVGRGPARWDRGQRVASDQRAPGRPMGCGGYDGCQADQVFEV